MAHRDILLELVELARPTSELEQLAHMYPYDYEGTPVSLTRDHLKNVLTQCIEGRIPPRDLERWAGLIEGRPGIDYEAGHEEQLSEVLFQLSTPEINEVLTPQKCWRLLNSL